MKTDFAVGDCCYADHSPDPTAPHGGGGAGGGASTAGKAGVVTELPEVLASARQLVAILTSEADKHVSHDIEDHLCFMVSCDAVVYVCYDAHARRPAPWLRRAGFRPTSSRVRTTDGVYALHERFYAKGSTVRLGGAEAKRSVKETRNYFVLMTTPAEDRAAHELAVDGVRCR